MNIKIFIYEIGVTLQRKLLYSLVNLLCDIDNRVLTTAQKELSEFFTDLKITKLYEKPNGKRGRNKVSGFKFSYTASQSDMQNKARSSKPDDNELDLDDIPF